MQLDRTSPKPLYMQIEELIRQNIATNKWPAGTLIASENELSRNYGVSRMTVRNVVTKLANEELLFRIPGKGTYVSEPKIAVKSLSYAGIREQLEQLEYTISTNMIGIAKERVCAKISSLFSLDEDALFYVVKRVRFIKEKPLSIHTSYVPVAFAEGLEKYDLVGEQLCKVLSTHYGLVRDRTSEILESVPASREDAKLLSISKGYPLLLLRDTIYDKLERPFEYSIVSFRGEMIKIKLEF